MRATLPASRGATTVRRGAVVAAAAPKADAPSAPAAVAAAVAAAALLLGSPAPAAAKVVLAKPATQGKKVFQGAPAAPRAPSAPREKKASGGGITLPSFGPSVGTLALPAALLAVGGGLAAATTVDPRFSEVLAKGALRDSNEYAGYEPALKSGNIPTSSGGGARKAAPKKKK